MTAPRIGLRPLTSMWRGQQMLSSQIASFQPASLRLRPVRINFFLVPNRFYARCHAFRSMILGLKHLSVVDRYPRMMFPSEPRQPLANILGLNRTVLIVLLAVFFFGLGEELWSPFMGIYLDASIKAARAETAQQVTAAGLWTIG